jgi:hypothetical protein
MNFLEIKKEEIKKITYPISEIKEKEENSISLFSEIEFLTFSFFGIF